MPVDVSEGKLPLISSSQDSLLVHIGRGGIWIYPILFFAFISLAIALFKAIQILRIKMPKIEEVRSILASIRSDDLLSAKVLADKMPAPVGPMLNHGIDNLGQPRQLLEEILYEKILDTRPRLNNLLPVIATTAAITPLLGLLGTVTGMINTFNLISLFGTGDTRILSSGISEALVTTEFGLIVAIPALIIHAVLSRRIRTILGDMEKYALIFSNGLITDDQSRLPA
jgi:biopolymer transport protein ExbB